MPRTTGPSRALVVDDDRGNRMVVEATLQAAGFDVIVAASMRDATAIMASVVIDVLLLDVMMPGESGLTACRRLRGDAGWDGLPIILMTALDSSHHRADALALGADDWIQKPIHLEDLERTARKWAATGRSRGMVPPDLFPGGTAPTGSGDRHIAHRMTHSADQTWPGDTDAATRMAPGTC